MSLSKVMKNIEPNERRISLQSFFKESALKAIIISLVILISTIAIKGGAYYILIIEMPVFIIMIAIYGLVGIIVFAFFKLATIYRDNEKKYYKIAYTYDLFNFFMKTICVLYVIMMYAVSVVRVSGESMYPTYHNKDFLLVWSVGYKPSHDDVIIIHVSQDDYDLPSNIDEDLFIKRVVGLPGDVISSNSGVLTLNGEIYTRDDKMVNYYKSAITLGKNEYFVVGDNYENSLDSRYIGVIKKKDVIGKVVYRILPFNRFGEVK